MVGYKGYNSVTQSWEYHTVANKTSQQPQQQYIQPINLNLANSVMRERQIRYDRNLAAINQMINDMRKIIREDEDFSVRAKNYMLDELNSKVNSMSSKNYDLSSNQTTSDLINYLNKLYEAIIRNGLKIDE